MFESSLKWRMLRSGALAVGALSVAASVACYGYVPVSTGVPKVGERVRVHLSPNGMVDLAPSLGQRVALAEGTLQAVRDDSTLIVGVDWVQTMDGGGQAWSGQAAVSMGRPDVAAVERRSLDRRRTAIAGIGLASALVAVAITALKSAGVGGGPGPAGGGTPP